MDSAAIANTENNSNKNGGNTETERQLKERAERNRQRALLLKKSKVITHPYVRCVSSICIRKSLMYLLMRQSSFNDQIL